MFYHKDHSCNLQQSQSKAISREISLYNNEWKRPKTGMKLALYGGSVTFKRKTSKPQFSKFFIFERNFHSRKNFFKNPIGDLTSKRYERR